ncbi:hypothetical protein N7533_001228 [Penicillium manginii]|uniref:uncharacterized protein n=1 Tax=Penicillium manginii TaxID=203109 RepID=UPI002548DCC6|nr:uncharacterized protein N7533_001228 [Penicillium manginii]KAJ5768645.1 hypothetical protein N7533_001228 [Penicillium manginii]
MATGDARNRLLELVQLPMQAGNDANRLRPIMLLLPIAGLARLFHWSAAIVLVVNLVAIIFLSDVISSASDELADSLGHLQGALIGATLGNTVELTSGVLALLHGDIVFAQSVMIFGFCIVTASYNKHVLEFNGHLAKTLSSLMMITAVTMLLPTALYSTFPVSQIDNSVLAFSRGTSFVLFLLYAGYLYFHMKTHKHLFLSDEEEEEEEQEPTQTNGLGGSEGTKTPSEQPDTSAIFAPSMRLAAAVAATIFSTELIFEGVDDIVETLGFSRMFIAVILIPIASNSTEGTTVIASARSGDTDSAIRVIVDSLLQIGLFVIPLLVMIGWCIGEPMSLYFDPFQSGIMFLAVLVVNHLLRDGQYAYIHGAMLVAL